MNNPTLSSFLSLKEKIETENPQSLFEDHSVLRFDSFQCRNEEMFTLIKSFTSTIENEQLGSITFAGEVLREVDIKSISSDYLENENLTLVVNKLSKDNFYYFFTLDGFKNALEQPEFIYRAKRIWISEGIFEFSTILTDFLQWGSSFQPPLYTWQGLSDPRKLVRDISIDKDHSVPHDIRPWLFRPNRTALALAPSVIDIWKINAAKNLLMTLPNEVRLSEEEKKVCFRGEKLREVDIDDISDQDLISLFPILHLCAEWIYSKNQEAEIRHTLLNYQLASESTGETKWPNKVILERAFRSADEAYKLHVQKASRELLKAYDDIKNTLQSEVNKVAENTRGLVTNFWRDFAIAAAVLVFNFTKSSNNLSSIGIKVLYIATAAFLILSLLVTVITNAKFTRIAQNNREMWRKRLYPFIDNQNYADLVDTPISKGLTIYNIVVIITSIIYLIMSSYLIYVALAT